MSSTFNGVELSSRTIPARNDALGGDWCDSFALSRHVLAISIGDVCGHGAALHATAIALRGAIQNALARGLAPDGVLSEASRFLARSEPEMHATSIFALLDTRRRTLTFANAGHPPPFMSSPDESRFLEYVTYDAPLGVSARQTPALRVVPLPAEALLVFYTDGVTERAFDSSAGEALIRDSAAFAWQFPGLPSAGVIERQMFLRGTNRDDAAILTARMPRATPALTSAVLAA